MFKKIAGAIAAAMLAGAVVLPSQAMAVSYPYVDDCNEWSSRSSVITVVACGDGKLTLSAKQGGKKLKVKKHHRGVWTVHHRGVWTVVIKNKKAVKLTAKDRSGKRSISYRVL